jgi:hypothetical protein
MGMKRVVFAVTAGAFALAAPAALGKSPRTPSCKLVTAARLTRLLKVQFVSDVPITDETPHQTACGYNTRIISEDATIVYTTKAGKSVYTIDKNQAGAKAKAVPVVGGEAFSFPFTTGVGNGLEPGTEVMTSSTQTEVDMLLGNVEVRINAYAPVARVEAVAKAISASI